jgi:ubiquinone/menaquinone biosynthesis C-methylase UbiE
VSDLVAVLAVVLVAFGIVALGWWLFIETEGVYLGRRIVVWLYDLYAGRYDDIKHFQVEYDHMFLAQPIMSAIAPVKSPLVLDVATGTARLPLALLRHAHFQGRVIGLDLSRRMLAHATPKLDPRRAPLLWSPAETLPFPKDTFDVVTCVESLEFMENPDAVLWEAARVLRPGGLLLISNRRTARLMPGKAWKEPDFESLFKGLGMREAILERWQVDYDLIWSLKRGESQPTLARPLAEVLRCPCCSQVRMVEEERAWRCEHCGCCARIGDDGVIELAPLFDQHLDNPPKPD